MNIFEKLMKQIQIYFAFVIMIIFLLLFATHSLGYQPYFGNIHSHSTYSDGKVSDTNLPSATAAQAFTYARDIADLDFLAVTDHNHLQAGMSLSHFQLLIDDATASNDDGNFVSLYGIEWGNIDTGGHVIYYEIPKLFGWQKNLYHQYVGIKDYHSLADLVKQQYASNSQTGFLLLAHPQSYDYEQLFETSYNQAIDDTISLIQVKNGPAYSEHEDYQHESEQEYEDKYFKALSLGYHVSPTADQDNHNGNWGTSNSMRTVAWAKNLSKNEILLALKNGLVYATEDKNLILEFSIDNCIMGSSLQKNQKFSLVTKIKDADETQPLKKIELYFGIVGSNEPAIILFSKDDTDTLSYDFDPNDYHNSPLYFFVKVIQNDSDRAWSAPIYVNDTMIAQKCFDEKETFDSIDDEPVPTSDKDDETNSGQTNTNNNIDQHNSDDTNSTNTMTKTNTAIEKNSGCSEFLVDYDNMFLSSMIIFVFIILSLKRKKYAADSNSAISFKR